MFKILTLKVMQKYLYNYYFLNMEMSFH